MAEFNVANFRSQMVGDGARPNLFSCTIPDLTVNVNGETGSEVAFNFMCRAAQLPGSTVNSIPVNYFGRELKFSGNRVFSEWTVTIINDEDFQLRTAFERWANVISKLDDATGVTNPSSYMTEAYVQQLGRGAERFATTNEGGQSAVLRTYKFFDIFPTNISQIALSYDSGDTLEEFTVSFDVQYYTIGNSLESSGSNNGEVLIE